MGYYEVKQIYPWLYSICDPQHVFCYLLVGEEKALLYDTAYGIGSLPDVIRAITDKPVTVVLGHGHIDHANGAYQFDEVYVHEADVGLFQAHTSETFRRNIVGQLQNKSSENESASSAAHAFPEGFDPEAYITAKPGRMLPISAGDGFDLGGLSVEVVAMPGHTAGSIGLWVKEAKVLLDSDAANGHIWMFLAESLPVSQYIAMLERVSQLDFEVFFIGHSDTPLPKSEFDKYIRAARNISLEKSVPYRSLPGHDAMLYREDGVEIAFDPSKLS